MKKLIITFFLVAGFHTIACHTSQDQLNRAGAIIKERIIKQEKEQQFKNKFNELVEFIKKKEGWRSTPYICLGGYRTIGYGFVTKYITKGFRDTITQEQGDSIIRTKLTHNIARIKQNYPLLNRYQQLSISSLMYAKGLGRIQKHPIHNELKKGFASYNNYVYFSRWEVERAHYRKARTYEYNLFNFKE